MFFYPWLDVAIAASAFAIQNEHEFQAFCRKQCEARKYVPNREEYFNARRMAYFTENPPHQPWIKTIAARFLTWAFKL